MRRERIRVRAAVWATLIGAVSLVLGACTGGGSAASSTPRTVVETRTPTPSPSATAAVVAGPTTTRSASACPWASQSYIANTMGERLGTVTVQVSGGQDVGCRVYALQHPNAQCDATCLAGEKLPGPDQPVIQVRTQRYPSATAAHNAFVLLAEQNRSATQTPLGSTVGLCFQTDFYPADKGDDWACAVSSGTLELIVNSVDTTGSFGVSTLTAHILAAL